MTELRAAIAALNTLIAVLEADQPGSMQAIGRDLLLPIAAVVDTDLAEYLLHRPRLAFAAPFAARQRVQAILTLARLRADLLDELVVLERVG